MSKDKLQLLSPLFLKYQAEFEKNPRSRVFAPLAESYRKLGMTDKAMEILSQGIRFHPKYLMGYLGLAFCYYDLKQYNLAYSTLKPFIETNRDNIRLQKLFSEICLELGKKEEALETLKYLLFINPRDKEIAELVLRVEKEVEEKYQPQYKPIIIPEKEFTNEDSIKPITAKNDVDDWMTVDLNQETKTENFENWNVKKVSEVKEDEPRSYHVHLDLDEDSDPSIEAALKDTFKAPSTKTEITTSEDDTPLVTHTLVDLYCGQGHIEKALEVLEKILLLNPNDQKTIQKISEIKALVQPLEQYDLEKPKLLEISELPDVSEEDGRRHLMSLIDEKLRPLEIEDDHSKVVIARMIEEKLSLFLKKIQKRALDYQSCL